ncbi:MAG: hypothetical protein Q4G43_02440 [Mobilicoccus sp.]|nr:hypothetical protein [Mobilicoccus sp.]
MLENVEGRERFAHSKRGELKLRLADLQRRCADAGIPVLVQIDGWECSGKGYVLAHLLRDLDPRGYSVHVFDDVDDEDRLHVPTHRYWQAIPAQGEFTVFDRSVYTRVLNRLDMTEDEENVRLEALSATERALADDGTLVVKIFLDITRKEQASRIAEYASDAREALIGKDDRRQQKHYVKLRTRFADIMARTHFAYAPWQVVDAHDRKQASIEVLGLVCEAAEAALEARDAATPPSARSYGEPPTILQDLDLDHELSRDEYDDVLDDLQDEASALAYRLADAKIPTVMVFEGMDAAGKGGAIRRLVKKIDPRIYSINPTAAPSGSEKKHHYLWRFYNNIPARGRIAVFDRSWYGRVMVERVEGFATEHEWERAYGEINAMETELTGDGVLLLKFFLYIDTDEQLERFESRKENKPWKLTDEDWRNREKWDVYVEAINEMLARTDDSPWTIIAGNDKLYARVQVLKTFITAAQDALD